MSKTEAQKFSIYRVCRGAHPAKNPDWRESYDRVARWTGEAIAFEFLRRNPAYWELWELVQRDAPSADQFREVQRLMARFGLWRVNDPRLPLADRQFGPWSVTASISARYLYTVQSAAQGDHTEYRFGKPAPPDTITIDLRADAPVEAQVDFVRWVLNRVRVSRGIDHRNAPRFQRSLFGDYLRLLDARDDGASFKTIAREVYPRRKEAVDLVRKRLKAAQALTEGGYKDMLLWGSVHIPELLQKIPVHDPFLELWDLAESGDSEGFQELWTELFPSGTNAKNPTKVTPAKEKRSKETDGSGRSLPSICDTGCGRDPWDIEAADGLTDDASSIGYKIQRKGPTTTTAEPCSTGEDRSRGQDPWDTETDGLNEDASSTGHKSNKIGSRTVRRRSRKKTMVR
jgi:hypothetical protein